MNHYNYTTISRIISKFKRDIDSKSISVTDVIEWTGEALEFLHVEGGSGQNAVDFVKVENYMVNLPKHLLRLHLIVNDTQWYSNSDNCNKDVVEEMCMDDKKDVCTYTPGVALDCNGQFKENEYVAYFRPIAQMAFDDAIRFLTKNSRMVSRFSILKPTNNLMFDSYHCSGEMSSIASEYKVDNGKVKFGFKEGQVAIAYNRPHLDDNGYPMIPDNISIITAVTKYITYKITESQFYNYIRGSQSRFLKSEADWQFYARQAKNEILMPDINMMEDLSNRDYIHNGTRLFDNYFGNSSGPDSYNYFNLTN